MNITLLEKRNLMIFNFLLASVICFLVTAIATFFFISYAKRKSLIDMPTQRSSHSTPTPRGGGVVFGLAIMMTTLFFYLSGLLDPKFFFPILAGAAIIFIGFIDDFIDLSFFSRLIVHFVCAITAIFFLGFISINNVLEVNVFADFIQMGITVFFIVWMTNLYNFMDGINGIAALEAISVSFCMILILLLNDDIDYALLIQLLTVIFCVAGFTIWNFPKARIFMGDSGSAFLGYLFSLYVIYSQTIDTNLVAAWLILLGIFICDATLTLFSRILRGGKFYQPHKTHAYQILASHFRSHSKATLSVIGVNILWLFPIAFLVSRGSVNGIVGIFIAYLPLAIIHILMRGGKDVAAR